MTGTSHRLFLLFYNTHFFTVPESVDNYGPDGATFSYGRQPLRQTITFAAEAGRQYRVDGHITVPTRGVDQ